MEVCAMAHKPYVDMSDPEVRRLVTASMVRQTETAEPREFSARLALTMLILAAVVGGWAAVLVGAAWTLFQGGAR
jgi:hypothetical protein